MTNESSSEVESALKMWRAKFIKASVEHLINSRPRGASTTDVSWIAKIADDTVEALKGFKQAKDHFFTWRASFVMKMVEHETAKHINDISLVSVANIVEISACAQECMGIAEEDCYMVA